MDTDPFSLVGAINIDLGAVRAVKRGPGSALLQVELGRVHLANHIDSHSHENRSSKNNQSKIA
jgi:hypothetical protein